MDRKALDVVQMQAVPRKERRQAVQRVIEEMLVVDRVEFAFLYHVDGVGEFEDRRAVGLQELGETGDEIVDRVDMRHDVVGDHDVGELPLGRKTFSEAKREKIVDGWNADT